MIPQIPDFKSPLEDTELYLSIINNLRDGVYFVTPDRRITFWSKGAERITGFSKEEIVGKCCQSNLLKHIDKKGTPLCLTGCPLFATLEDGKQRIEEVFLRHKDGHRIPVLTNIFPIRKDGLIVGAIEIFTIASPKVYEDTFVQSLTEQAMNDHLTKLPNRMYLDSFLDYKIDSLRRFNLPFCVLFADIDNFRVFNNIYGHDMGDRVLISVGESIKHSLRSTDLFGRWGGEEFVGIFSVANEEEARIVGEKFRILVEGTELRNGDTHVSVTVSVGVTMAILGESKEDLLKRADSLMYKVKKGTKNAVCFG